MINFSEFPKMARLSRRVIVTEKIDGTNAQICINKYSPCEDIDTEECIDIWTNDIGDIYTMHAGSRTKWITPQQDNFGFASWAKENKDQLRQLDVGRHFGEWWGRGIQRKYGLKEKKFSLFNTLRWCKHGETPQQIQKADPRIIKFQDILPECCDLVPVLYDGEFDTAFINGALTLLQATGSKAAPGFMNPEGIVVFHEAGQVGFKKTIENDHQPKSLT
jgi:hypothetical protein